jgi:hypothetical protein
MNNLVTQALLQYSIPEPKNQGITFLFPEFQSPITTVYLALFSPPPELA